jgi:rubrerythrin
MQREELKIDLASVAALAVKDLQPGEDLDEALLRSCKKLYGESGVIAFDAIQSALSAFATKKKIDKGTALAQLVSGQEPVSITSRTETVTTERIVGSLDELPPEIRRMAQEAAASGKSQQKTFTMRLGSKTGSLGTLSGDKSAGTYRCQNCGGEFSSEIGSCPTCGRPRKTSFWSRLFGR